jgi:hypothetical protein
MKRNHQNINTDSGSDEYFTPIEIVESARRVMGRIDLDPASCATANKRIKASHIWTIAEDGLSKKWYGAIWLNHPFGRETNNLWIQKLSDEFNAGRVLEAVCISFASTSERWFRPLLDRPQCFFWKRTNFYLPDGTIKKGVTKGCVVTYFGDNVKKFASEFSKLGTVKISFPL